MNNKTIGKLHCSVIMSVKLSLWSAIKLRIAGISNPFKLEKHVTDFVNEAIKDGRINAKGENDEI